VHLGAQEWWRVTSSDFCWEQSLGHVTHAKNLLTNVVLDPEVHAHWGLIDFEATGVAGRVPVYKSNWTVRAGVRAYREVARMNRQTKLDALFFHTQVAGHPRTALAP